MLELLEDETLAQRIARSPLRVFFLYDDYEVHVADFHDGRPGEPRRLFRIPELIKDLAGVLRDGRLVLAVYDQRVARAVPLHVITGWTPEASRP